MARSNQTFQKRQRENKLREKAQRKRELRQQRRSEKKAQIPGSDIINAEPILDDVNLGAESEGNILDRG